MARTKNTEKKRITKIEKKEHLQNAPIRKRNRITKLEKNIEKLINEKVASFRKQLEKEAYKELETSAQTIIMSKGLERANKALREVCEDGIIINENKKM